jgi:A/G-specific adenine glycosylase
MNDKVLAESKESSRRPEWIRTEILVWAQSNLRDFPWRRNPTPLSILYAEVLLRRTTASAVLRIYTSFMKEFGDLKKIRESTEDELEQALSTIGYQRQRAKIFKDISNCILLEFGGVVPCAKESLLRIPHVGSYTAGAILSLGCNQRSAMVDTNVKRIYGRVFSCSLPEKAKDRFIEKVAASCIPRVDHQTFNLALLDLAALVCTYGIPRCRICPLSRVCDYYFLRMPNR